jgi:chromosome segregation ATPase
MQALKNYLQENPNIKTVYFNDKGEWQFFKHGNFPKEVSRKEALAMKVEEEKPAAVENEEEVNQLKAEIATKESEIVDLKSQIEVHEAIVKAKDEELAKKQEEVNGKDKEIVDLKSQITKLEKAAKK